MRRINHGPRDAVRCAATLLAGFAMACEPASSGAQDQEVPRERSYTAVDSPLYVIGNEEGESLMIPGPMNLDSALLYVFDYGDFQLKAFDAETGVHRFSIGRSGEGPGEYRNPIQIATHAGSSQVWILDGGIGRISVIENGHHVADLPLPPGEDPIASLLRLQNGTLATLFSVRDRFWARFDSATGVSEFRPFPTPGLAAATPIHRQTSTATDQAGARWAAVFVFTNTFAIYEDTAQTCIGHIPLALAIEELGPNPIPPFQQRGPAFIGSMLAILAGDSERDLLYSLDLYDASDCRYLGSQQLPERGRALASNGRVIAVTYPEPVPRIVVYPAPRRP